MLFGRQRKTKLEDALRAARPRAPHDLLDELSGGATVPGRSGGMRKGAARLGVLGIATVALAAVGGIGFAASTALDTAKVKVEKVASGSARTVSVNATRNAASDQYGEGTIKTEDGPPELTVTGGTDNAVKGTARSNNNAITLTTSITPNESGTLSIQVIGADGKPVTISGRLTTVDGDAVGEGEAVIYRSVVNTPRRLPITITIPSRVLTAGEELEIKLGYTDRDASRKRTVITIPAEAPDALPKTTRTFRLTQDDLQQIQDEAQDDGLYGVSFRAFVTGDNPTITIDWNGETTNGRSTGTFSFNAEEEQTDNTAVVTVTGGTIGGGDFKIVEARPVTENGRRCSITMTAVRTGSKINVRGTTDDCGTGRLQLRALSDSRKSRKANLSRFDSFDFEFRDPKSRYTRVRAIVRSDSGSNMSVEFVNVTTAAKSDDDLSEVDNG